MHEDYCTDEIWNWNETWNTDIPDFSSCFQDTVLVLVPCVVFSFVSIVNLCLLSRRIPLVPLPWTWRIILKLVLGVVLFIISTVWCSIYTYQRVSDGSSHLHISTITASFARPLTFVILIALMLKHRHLGIATSTVLSLFWICFALCGAIMHRSVILKYDTEGLKFDWNYVLVMLYYPLIYLGFIMSLFADSKNYTLLERGSPLDEEPFLSGVTYAWFNRTVYRSIKNCLTVKDLLPLAIKLKASYLYEVLSNHWKFNLQSSETKKKQNLFWVLLQSFWPWLLAALILDICFVLTLLVPPLLLDKILQFVKDDRFLWRQYFYCGIIFFVTFLNKTIENNCIMYLLCAAAQVKSALISAIFRKNLVVASSSRKDFTSGSITNLISVDVQRISSFAVYSSILISCPFRIIMIIYLLWQYLGPSCLAGVTVIFVLIPISFYVSRVSEKFMAKQMEVKDKRLKIINEILSGIKILKLYSWEIPFSKRISDTRKEEVKLILYSQLCFVITCFVYNCVPILVSIANFTTYLLVNSDHVLDPTRAFVSLNLLEQLRFSLFSIPDALSELIQTITAVGRVSNFLTAEETDPNIVGNCPDVGHAVTIKRGNFFWSKDTHFALEDIDLNVPVRHLIAVIGPVGSGKSSLLSAILGEMRKSSGSIDVQGTLAYVPQEAWILNRTLRNNILLEKPMHEQKYNRILEYCCLKPDLEILPGGDATEIGEKGINLSGGQKQRVSVARAIFQNRDIYIMDDPLSAVDAHVRKSLFDDVISNNGLLKNKTRILVTHDISVLPHVDLIIRMEEGRIIERGTYKELMDRKGTFLDFIQKHTGVSDEASGDEGIDTLTAEKKKDKYGRTISEDWAKPSEMKETEGDLMEEEKMEEGGVKRGIYLNYARHAGWLLFILSFLGIALFTTFEAGGNIWVSKWTADPVLNGTQNKEKTIWRLSVYGALGCGQAVTNVFGTAVLIYGSTKAAALYHNEMLDSVLKSPMSFFDTTPMGRIVNRFSTDMDAVDINIVYNIEGWINCLLFMVATFIVIGMNTPLFLASIIPLFIIYFIILKLHLNVSRQIKRLDSTTRSPIYSHMLESIYGVASIKAFQVEKQFIEKLEENLDNNIACNVSISACNRWLRFWLDSISCFVILIATWLAIEKRHELGPSVVGLILAYAMAVTEAMIWLVRQNSELENQSVAIERIDEYCRLPSEAPRNIPGSDPEITWPERGEIVFDNYSTRYRENLDLVLKSLNLNIHSSEKVGVVGRTGAGKSSITLALFRIVEPSDGTILIDNVDLSQIGLHALRTKLTIIPQDPVLFTGSLRFNLDPNDEYNDAAIWSSLENAHLKEYVSDLPDKLDHNVEEGGANLSAGQKQLLCLARALLKKSKILILDEATAAVDMDTDRLVQDTIKAEFADHTVITIAHRLNTVMDYDKIVVMDSGEVKEIGSPTSLLENKKSQFYYLCKEAGLT